MNSTVEFVGEFLPVDQPRSEIVDDFEQDETIFKVIDEIVYVNILYALRVYPVFKYSDLSAFISFRFCRQFEDFLFL
jgi:hypothetical protein